ncbi:hypothetical protein [Archangium violaceum]|uniref:hypothetical protein n=1 Tax=Archangium violaceum TaxID=83451 RepID=UPI0036DBDFA3
MPSSRKLIVMQLIAETRAMAMHALGAGLAVPGWVLEIVTRTENLEEGDLASAASPPPPSLRELARAHNELARLVAPATPELILMLEVESNVSHLKRLFGQTRITRSFILIAIVSILCFIATSLSPYLNDPKYGDFFTSSGLPLFINEIFFLSSAAVGASFSLLFQIDRELTAGTFSPKHQSSYWVQFILGIVAGLLMSTVLSISALPVGGESSGTGPAHLRNAALALIGGFSSSVVQRLIRRLIESLETMLRGSAEQEIQIREQAGRLRLDEALSKERLRVTFLLTDLQRRLAAGESPEELRILLARVSQGLFTNELPTLGPGLDLESSPGDTGAVEVRAVVEAEGPLQPTRRVGAG